MSMLRRPWALVMLGVILLACRHRVPPAPLEPSPPPWPGDEHCWWTAVRTPLPVDTVGDRFAHAFAALGLTAVVARRLGDTVLVRGGPTELGGARLHARYASRMVAYQHGDSTRFRWYSSITPVADRWATAAESASISGLRIGLCGDIGKIVSIQGWGTREPTHDDSIAVWTRLP
jgi:hypothetical protein